MGGLNNERERQIRWLMKKEKKKKKKKE